MIEKVYDIDEYVRKITNLRIINKGLQKSGKGNLVWDTKFDGKLFTLTIQHINEL